MVWTRVYDEPEPQRVNRWLAQSGVCSRREADTLITQRMVSIDGQVVEDAGRKIEPGQTLTLSDRAQVRLESAFTAVINKPVGIVSAQPEDKQVPAVRLLTRDALVGDSPRQPDRDTSLAPLGRLDMDSHGLLLLSDDGVLAKALIGPDSVLEKEYLVQVGGTVTQAKLSKLHHGLELDGRKLRPAGVEVVAENRLRIVLKEGRNRQIRRMCEQLELWVLDLQRIRIGALHLGDLPLGRWRALTADERAKLIGG